MEDCIDDIYMDIMTKPGLGLGLYTTIPLTVTW
jgi:hypothetical protein